MFNVVYPCTTTYLYGYALAPDVRLRRHNSVTKLVVNESDCRHHKLDVSLVTSRIEHLLSWKKSHYGVEIVKITNAKHPSFTNCLETGYSAITSTPFDAGDCVALYTGQLKHRNDAFGAMSVILDDGLSIDATEHRCPAAFVNHSVHANVGIVRATLYDLDGLVKPLAAYVALRHIESREEILLDYGPDYGMKMTSVIPGTPVADAHSMRQMRFVSKKCKPEELEFTHRRKCTRMETVAACPHAVSPCESVLQLVTHQLGQMSDDVTNMFYINNEERHKTKEYMQRGANVTQLWREIVEELDNAGSPIIDTTVLPSE